MQGMNNTAEGVMTHQEFSELAGRIEGVARALMYTISALEDAGHINGPALCALLRQAQPRSHRSSQTLEVSARTLAEIAQALDDARSHRSARYPS